MIQVLVSISVLYTLQVEVPKSTESKRGSDKGAQGGLGQKWGGSGLVRRRRREGVEEVVTAEMEPSRSCDPTITGGEAPVTCNGGATRRGGEALRLSCHNAKQSGPWPNSVRMSDPEAQGTHLDDAVKMTSPEMGQRRWTDAA